MNNLFLYVITVLIWGSTWIAISYQLGDVAAEVSLVYRFALAAGLLFIYCHSKKLTLKFNLKQHLLFLLFGLTLFSCNYFFLYTAQQHINSALTCIAFSLILFCNIFNARIYYKTQISQQTYLGGLIGLIGITTLFWPQINHIEFGAQTLTGLGICLLGTYIASIGNMISMKSQQLKLPLMPSIAWGMFYGASFMALMTLVQGKSFELPLTPSYLLSLFYLSVFGSVIGFASYLTLLNRIGAHKASYTTIMFPAVAVVISTFAEDFNWSSYTVTGLVFILFGNLVVLAKPKKARVPAKGNSALNTSEVITE